MGFAHAILVGCAKVKSRSKIQEDFDRKNIVYRVLQKRSDIYASFAFNSQLVFAHAIYVGSGKSKLKWKSSVMILISSTFIFLFIGGAQRNNQHHCFFRGASYIFKNNDFHICTLGK